ncbi:hypothetical protein RF11_15963 [Thelohanellus kitauei]|uniref:Uncharacterized protein n=1 Tax=Thelohanellus kitauei TaxID=669202 RepID=A0A0C2IM58_THEKT|nr:hypothetical protein RF11_15963 [Thelohanellus kitauei]
MEKAAARRVDAHAILALMKTIFRFRTAEYMRNARGTQIHMGDCMNGICKCHKSFGVKFCKWYNGNACDKPVETVDIIFDYTGVHVIITEYYLPVCVALHKNCQRVYMLHFNFKGTDIEKITVQRLDRAKECHESPDFTKTLIYVCLITAAVITVIFVIVGFVYHFYFKQRQEQRSEEERHKRQWVLNSTSNAGATNEEAPVQEAS